MRYTLLLVLILATSSAIAKQPDIVDYDIELQVVQSGFDGEKVWFHPRASMLGNNQQGVMLMQWWYVKVSDLFSALHYVSTTDAGKSWSQPTSLEATLEQAFEQDSNVMVRISDMTPMWHKKSGTMLVTGHNVRYKDGRVMPVRNRETCWFSFDPSIGKWSRWSTLQMPDRAEFRNAGAGCTQRVDMKNGDILLPIYYKVPEGKQFTSAVVKCSYDGKELKYKSIGGGMGIDRGRGLYEPSMVEFKGRYYMTLRNDINGFVAVSKDGMNFSTPYEWRFDDGTMLMSENTQQHWIKHKDALFLVYTSKREDNGHVMRSRAPLFIAQFDHDNMVLIKSSERVLIPNHGAQLGNFGAFEVDDNQAWVTTSEGTRADNVKYGSDGRLYIAKIRWKN